jgi:hypothetical protein
MIEAWRKVFRDGIAPQLSTTALEALRQALATDDAGLLQGATTAPPPLQTVQDWPVEGACYDADRRLGEPAAVRWFLNWWDDSPRHFARLLLLAEVERELSLRKGKAGAA